MGPVLFVLIASSIAVACSHDFEAFEAPGEVSPEASPGVPPSPNPQPPAPQPAPPPPPAPPIVDAGKDADAASDAATCTLPAGATQCCGSIACVNSGGTCSSVCASCQSKCNDPKRPVCCAQGGSFTTCERRPSDC
jgi:hypothetical protein